MGIKPADVRSFSPLCKSVLLVKIKIHVKKKTDRHSRRMEAITVAQHMQLLTAMLTCHTGAPA